MFGLDHEPLLCEDCRGELVFIEGEICRQCGRAFSLFPEKYRQNDLCSDCVEWNQKGRSISKNRSLLQYNSFLQEFMAQFKYRGDAELIKAFKSGLQTLFNKEFRDSILVPIPLSKERHFERGFNQSVLIAGLLDIPMLDALARPLHEEKQSKKSRLDRLGNRTLFSFKTGSEVHGKSIALVDDIYTTGATVEAAGKILLDHGARKVSSFTVARG
ncbi:ComF family protein [Alkalihalobacillus sp. EGI L200015]|nr:ComF family protein [Pseudalkalibacillus salsuginis]